MSHEIAQIIRVTTQKITRSAFVPCESILLRKLTPKENKGKPETDAEFTARRNAGLEALILKGEASWRGDTEYGDETEAGQILAVSKVNIAEFKMRKEADANALSKARKAKTLADKAEKESE